MPEDHERPAFAPPVAPDPAPARASAPSPAMPEERPWPWWTAFAALATGWLGGTVVGGVIITVGDPSSVEAGGGDPAIGWLIGAQLALSAFLVGSALFFARLGGRITPARFGLRPTPLLPAIGWIVVGFLSFTILGGLWLELVGAEDERDQITQTLKDDPSTATVAGLAFMTVILAPIVEEVVFRGYVFNALRSAVPMWVAAVGSGLLFGVVHIAGSPISFLLPLALLGTILALLLWKTGSLYPCIALHAVNNCIAYSGARELDATGYLIVFAVSAAGIALVLLAALKLAGLKLHQRGPLPH